MFYLNLRNIVQNEVLPMSIFKRFKRNKRGFSLVEVSIIVAVLVVVTGMLIPAVVKYTESSREQRDISAMEELVRAFQLSIVDADVLDEGLYYEIGNNFLTYTDSSGTYGAQNVDEEFWAPDGSGRATTITFNPDDKGNFVLADGYVNEMTYGNGSVVTPTRIMEERGAADPIQCKFSEMQLNGKNLLYSKVSQIAGEKIKLNSATYRQSSYTVFIKYVIENGVVKAVVHGEFNGTNLSPDCPASVGSGTDGFTENEQPNGNKQGTTESSYDSAALQGGGSISFKNYPVLEDEYIDPQKFWAFCRTVTGDITEIKVVAAYNDTATDISVSGNGRIVAFQDGHGVYITAAAADDDSLHNYSYKVMPAQNASNLFDANKTGFTKVEKISAHMLDVAHCTALDSMFKDNHLLKVIDIDQWDTSKVQTFSNMFAGCNQLQNVKIVRWDTTKARDMSYMYADCYSLTSIPTHQMRTDLVENMSHMFYNCALLTELDIAHFKTVNCRDMSSMFEGCARVLELDVSGFDTAAVVNMSAMFKDCVKLQTIDVSRWETALCQNMGKMFMNCKRLVDINLESWDTRNVKNMEQMFYSCQSIEELDLSTINSLAVEDIHDMFVGMNNLSMVTIGAKFHFRGSGRTSCALPAPSYLYIAEADGLWRDESGTTYDPALIPSCQAATYHAVGNSLPAVLAPRNTWWKGVTPKAQIERIKIVNKYRSSTYDEMWIADADNSGSIVVYIEGKTAYLVNMKNSRSRNAFQLSKDATGTFADFTNLKEIQGLRLINMINTSIADNFFDNCTSLSSIDGYEKWNVQNLVSTNCMFADTQIKFLQLGAWDMASITNLSNMFENTQLGELDLSNWNVSAVVSYDSMFKNSSKLTSIIMRGWETAPTANYKSMFEGCSSLRTISTSSTFTVGATNISMFSGCAKIIGGNGTPYQTDKSLYARVDQPDAPGYFTTDDNMGTFSARLYASGTATSSYNELTEDGAAGSAWDYRQGARLLEINLYAMPKRQEKTLSITVPEGMKIVNNSWTMPNNNIVDVTFTPLDRDPHSVGLQQSTGSHINSEAGTLTFTVEQYTTQTTIQLLVNMDTTTWSKAKTNNSLTVEDAITVSLGHGFLVKKLATVGTSVGLTGSNNGLSMTTDMQNTVVYVGEQQKLFRVANISSNEAFTVYWPEVEIKITSVGSVSGQQAKIISNTDNWTAKIKENKGNDYVFHKVYSDVKTSSIGLPLITYLLEEDKGWQKDETLTMKYEVVATNFNGDKVTYTGSRSVTVKDNSVDLSLLAVKASGATAPHISYYDGMPENVADHLGVIYIEYSGFADIPNVEFKYEYDVNTPTGAPKALVQAARVVVPSGQTVSATITLVNEAGTPKTYTKSLTGSNNSTGVFVRAMAIIPESDANGEQWYLKTINYTVPKITGSKTSITYYCSHWSEASPSGAGVMIGRVKAQSSHKLTLSQNGVVIKTATANTNSTTSPAYSAYVSAIATPLGSTIAAGSDFQMDISVSGVTYPYTNSCNVVDPTVWIVLPEDISIVGAQIANSSNVVIDENPIVTRVKSITKSDGSVAFVYQINMTTPELISTYIVTNTGTSNKNCPLKFKILCETDVAMKSTTLMLRDTVWFSNRKGPTALGGAYNENNVADKYDVNNNGNKSEKLSVLKDSVSSIVIQSIGD